VAGVIAAEAGNGIGIVGIAPNADILALRACWPERPGIAEAVCNSFTLALAINEAVRLDSHIINLSLAGPRDALVEKLLQAAIDRGIIVVAADPATKTGDSPFPATMRNVIAVRSDSADSRPSGSAANGITAPGAGVLTTVPQGAYDFMNGSSFAAPHISGILALMRELKPRLNGPDALVLLRTLEAPSLSPASQPLPSVNACQALAEVSGRRNCGG
jgi:subtilisin family serine protease